MRQQTTYASKILLALRQKILTLGWSHCNLLGGGCIDDCRMEGDNKEGSGRRNQQPTIAREGGGSCSGGGGGRGGATATCWGATRGGDGGGSFGNDLLSLYDDAGSFQVEDDNDSCIDDCRTAGNDNEGSGRCNQKPTIARGGGGSYCTFDLI